MATHQTVRGAALAGHSPSHRAGVCTTMLYTTPSSNTTLHDGRQAKNGP